MKKLLRLLIVLIALLIGAVIAGYIYLDVIAKAAIERGGAYALGVDTSLDSARLKVFDGQLALHDLELANPKDFGEDHFLTLEDGDVAVTLASLRQNVIEVPTIALNEIDVNLQKKDGKSNYNIILENLKRLESDVPQAGKRYIVKELHINDIMLHVNLLGAGDLTNIDIPIDEIRLRNVGSETSRGVLLSELWGVLIKAILAAAVDKAGGVIPADMLGDLKNGLGQLEDLTKIADIDKLGELLKPVGDLGEGAKKLGEGTVEEINKAVGEIGNLLGGDGDGKKKSKP